MFYVDVTKCTGCGSCVENCPQGAISLRDGKAYIEKKLCKECGSCWELCPNNAICEVETPAAVQRRNLRPDMEKVNTGNYLPGRRQSDIIKAVAGIIPVAIELFSAYAGKRNAKGGGKGKRLSGRLGRGTGRKCRRRGKNL